MTDMDEVSLPEQVEALKDDPAAWGEPVAAPPGRKSRSERRQRGAVVSVRLSAEELELLQAYAAHDQESLSAVLRARTLEAARRALGTDDQPAEVTPLVPRRNSTYTYPFQVGNEAVVVAGSRADVETRAIG